MAPDKYGSMATRQGRRGTEGGQGLSMADLENKAGCDKAAAAPGQKLDDDIYLEDRIDVPDPDLNHLFTWRRLWLFTGPGWLSRCSGTFKGTGLHIGLTCTV